MIKEAIQNLVSGQSLTMDEAAAVVAEIMSGKATPAQFGAFVTALRLKGETVEEIAGLAKVMRDKASPVKVSGLLVDTCGTGGDAFGTFNISTTAAFIVAGAGLRVAKHGNRAMTSQCGSADVLEALGVKIDLGPEGVQECLEKAGIGFMFAPVFHPAMKHAAGPRREIGVRTVFNILGPLTNPAGAQSQVIGVSDTVFAPKMAQVLQRLGCQHALVTHGEEGLDEISICGGTKVWEVKGDESSSYVVAPEEFGFKRADIYDIKGGTAEENAKILRNILRGATGPAREVVLLNAAAALVAGDLTPDIAAGVEMAREVLDSGAALQKLEGFIKVSQDAG